MTFKYRADIDGLRAVAVVPVVLFHLGVPILQGGFVGVDVFFVISGFLITTIINEELDHRTFSLAKFYERRIRRILPALFVMMIAVALAGWVVLLPAEFKNFGQSLTATALFSSNLLFWFQGMDYFDGPADLKPLLHTWSLAVEEQYYIVFPLVLALVEGKRSRLILFVLISAASFALSQWYLGTRPSSAFYLPQSRCWELLAGSLVAVRFGRIRLSERVVNIATALGLILVLTPMFFYSVDTRFPGVTAIPPVLGTALILASGENVSLFNVLQIPLFVLIGRLSYSLYLWHWPLIVLYKYYYVASTLSWSEQVGLFVASFGFAALSFVAVERPVKT